VLVLVGGLALLAFLYGHARRDVSSRRAHLQALNAQTQQAQAAAAGLAPYTNFIALREERERAVSQLVDARFDWAHTLHELGRVLPSNASVTSIDGSVSSSTSTGSGASSGAGASSSAGAKASSAESASLSPTSATPAGSVPTITVAGCATSQAEVAITLNRLRLIDGVSEVTLQSSTKTTSGASAGASGAQCPSRAPAFTALLTFDPLPVPTSASASIVPVGSGGRAR
jgi:Tfp pilus assembly protein PilN